MNEIIILNRRRLSARLYREEVAALLGLKEHDLDLKGVRKLLPPLNDEKGAVKYWAAVDVDAAWRNRALLARISRAIYEHWQKFNKDKGGADELSLAE
jgi:hypothetical protein